MKKTGLIMISIFVLSVFYGCSKNTEKEGPEVKRPEITGVVIKEVTPLKTTEYYEAAGTVRTKNRAFISSKIMAVVKAVNVKAGESVQKGDLLISLGSPDIEARADAAAGALGEAERAIKIAGENKELMERTFERFSRLYEEKGISEQEFDEIKSRRQIADLRYQMAQKSFRKAEAALNEAEAFMDYLEIRSPMDGIVAEKKIDIGSMAVPGTPLLTIDEPAYRIETPVSEQMLGSISRGLEIDVYIQARGLITKGTVNEMTHEVDPGSRTFTVKIGIEGADGPLLDGSYAKARFPAGQTESLFINEGAVVKRGKLTGVYVVDRQGIVTLRLIKTGEKRDGMIKVLSGLRAGERIITDGAARATDGGTVKNGEG